MSVKEIDPDLEARSPWSGNQDMNLVKLHGMTRAAEGSIRLPGSKSQTNRALLLAALAQGTSRIDGMLRSDDSYWCIACLKKLGVRVDLAGESAIIEGCGGEWPLQRGELYVGASGTLARFLPGVLAIGSGRWTVQGSRRMSERPLAPLLDALASLGAKVEIEDSGRSVPFTIQGQGLHGGEVGLPGSGSSQFISGLLLAAPYAKEPVTLKVEGYLVQRDYVEMTLSMMRDFGIALSRLDEGFALSIPTGKYQAQSVRLEPDISTACYFWAAAALTNGRIRTEGIAAGKTLQPDIAMLQVLERMGCKVVRGDRYVEVHGTQQLQGGFTIDMREWSDQTLTLAALAVFADQPLTLTGAAHIRQHECDRLAAICTELRKLGIRADEHPDGLTVHPGRPGPATLDPHDDHRMAMALSLIGIRATGVAILDPGCVSKTCPDFFERMAALGMQLEYV